MADPGALPSVSIQTADITPTYSVPHDNAIAAAVTTAGDAAQGLVNDALKLHAQKVGAQAGAAVAAGTAPYQPKTQFTDVGQARQAAFGQAYLSGAKTDIDTHIDAAAQANPDDPASFQTAAKSIISGYVQNAPGPYAVQVQDYAQQRAGMQFNDLQAKKAAADQATAINGVNARQQTLSDTMLSLAAAGQEDSPAFHAAQTEWVVNNYEKTGNPIFEYAPEQAAEALSKQTDAIQGASATYHATQAYTAAGGGEAGLQAAKDLLDASFLHPEDGGPMADMDPGKRLKLYTTALANVKDVDKADAERRAIQAEQDRQTQADQRDAAGTMALGLVDGSVSEADVHDAEAKGQIQPGAAARLILGARAQARTAAAQDRAANTADRTANYGAMSELAAAGQLTPAQIAQNGGNLSPMQRLALSARVDKVTKPGVDNIVGLASAGFRDAGIQGAQAKLATDMLHSDARQYMLNSPSSTVGQQAQFAANWVKKNQGIVIPTAMKPGGGPVQTLAQVAAAYRAKFKASPPTDSDVNSVVARYKAAHPSAH